MCTNPFYCANGCFKVIVSKTRTVAEWWAKLFSPSYRQWRELFCHFVTKPNLSDCIIFLFFFGNMHCLLSKNFFEPREKNVSYETWTLQWKVWFTTVILIFFYCSSLVAIWPQCHALHEKPLFERWFICVCVFFSFFFSQIEFFNQNDDVLPFSQFPPERFLYLNVGLISLDVWLVDKIYFFFYFFDLCFYFYLNKVWQTRDMILGKPWLSMKINSVKKQELRWTLILMHFFLFSVD